MSFSKAFLLKDADGSEEQLLEEILGERSIPIEWYSYKHIQRRVLDLSGDVFLAGTIKCVHGALKQLGKNVPTLPNYPQSLSKYLKRRVWTSTIKELRTYFIEGSGRAVFAKPFSDTKLFTGAELRSLDDVNRLGDIAGHIRVWCSELISFLTEYRVYVANGKICSIAHYAGDKQLKIDETVVSDALAAMKNSEEIVAGFAMDFGLDNDGRTILVEVNDGYGLGAYDISAAHYFQLIASRWNELIE